VIVVVLVTAIIENSRDGSILSSRRIKLSVSISQFQTTGIREMYKLVIAAISFFALYLVFHFVNHRNDDVQSSQTETQAEEQYVTGVASLISSAPANASVSILEPIDGAVLSSPISIKFGITNMQVAPAGTNVENSGHHHLLIDMDELPDLSLPLPATEQLVHFGKGQTQTQIELSAGTHTLQLLLGNYLHIPHDVPVISEKITITVQ
jgi:hypothetical protein